MPSAQTDGLEISWDCLRPPHSFQVSPKSHFSHSDQIEVLVLLRFVNGCLHSILCILVQIMHFHSGYISQCSFIVDKMPEQGKHNIVAAWHCPLSHKTLFVGMKKIFCCILTFWVLMKQEQVLWEAWLADNCFHRINSVSFLLPSNI